jgi:putative GTP pyrophosphokinase
MTEGYEALDLKCQMIVDEYDERRPLFERIRELAEQMINKALKENHVEVTAVEARIKKRDSLIGKLVRKGHKYHTLDDITDILGTRVITLFSDDVDRVASYMEKMFDVDWNESIDKRKMHQMDSFGYNSLHYICRIPKTLYNDPVHPELNNIRFEIQMRSTLQHAWAAMEHDIGYKSEIETPPEYMRMLGRLAGMLELADEEFSRIRISVAAYRRKMESLIQAGELKEVSLDGDTYNTYIAQQPFSKLTQRIADINQGEIQEMSFAPFFPLLKEAGMKTLQDVEDFIKENEDDAYKFAMSQLSDTDIDIIASTVALQDLLIVSALKKGGGKPALIHIYDELNGKSIHNERLAEMAFKQACNLPFMNK